MNAFSQNTFTKSFFFFLVAWNSIIIHFVQFLLDWSVSNICDILFCLTFFFYSYVYNIILYTFPVARLGKHRGYYGQDLFLQHE